MLGRIGALFLARLRATARDGAPIAALFSQAVIAAVFCGLVEDTLPPFAYALFALALSGALVALPLLGELGWILREDEASEWIGSLPVRTREIAIARTLFALVVLAALTLAALLPAVLLGPHGTSIALRAALPLLGLGQALFVAALLFLAQALLGGRAESLLVLLQTLVVVGIVVGLVAGLEHVPELARLAHPGADRPAWLAALPTAWFAAPFDGRASWSTLGSPIAVTIASLAVLALAPAPGHAQRTRGEPLLARLLRPARRLATRAWVRAEERGSFDLVYDALPREREVVLRTYPMIGIPLAFLVLAATGTETADGTRRLDLVALLIFTTGIYLPILLVHVPASASHRARWILDGAPLAPHALAGGAIKALALRFLLPLYGLLGILACFELGPVAALRLVPAGALASLAVLRRLYPICVEDSPLSIAPERVKSDLDWLGLLGGLAVILVAMALVASRLLTTIPSALALVALLLVVEIRAARALERGEVPRVV